MLDPKMLEARLKEAMPAAEIQIRDTTGTGDHFEARIVASEFEGKSMIEQHRIVYAPLQDLLASGALHALALKTYSPTQWQKLGK